jgi:phage FluMu gp28-like protein
MFPSTTNRLAGTFLDRWRAMIKGEDTNIRRDLKLRVVSTFNGRNNKFFTLWERAKENGYAAHKVTIHDAIKDGIKDSASKGGAKVVEGALFKATYIESNRSVFDKDAFIKEFGADAYAKFTKTTAIFTVKVTSR